MPCIWQKQKKSSLQLNKTEAKPLQRVQRKENQMLNCNPVSCGVLPIPAASSKSSDILTPCRSSRTPGWLSRVSLNLSVSSLEKHWYVFPSLLFNLPEDSQWSIDKLGLKLKMPS